MSVYVLGDLHLSTSVDKPMDVFGSRWQNYMERIKNNWLKIIKDEDTIIIPGDISWGLTLNEAKSDYDFIEQLPGKKVFFKGNHDLYWLTQAKMNKFISDNGYKTFTFMHNNAIEVEDFIICGTRGWYNDEKESVDDLADNKKIIAREAQRLKMSIDKALELKEYNLKTEHKEKEIIAFLHFPAVVQGYSCSEFVDELLKANIKRCYYGHLHGAYDLPYKVSFMGIDFYLTAADYLNFVPALISPKKL